MKEITYDSLKQKILQFFAAHPQEQFKPRVLARRLSIKDQQQIRLLQQILNELFQAKLIDRGHRKQYGHSAPPASHRLEGILSVTKQGNGIVSLLPPQEGSVAVQSKFTGTALNGDRVSVALFARPHGALLPAEDGQMLG